MNTLYPDKRKAIAGEFFLSDSKLKTRSRKAFKKIQSWKDSVSGTTPDPRFVQQIENLVRYSFFQKVTNTFILLQERYYEKPLEN